MSAYNSIEEDVMKQKLRSLIMLVFLLVGLISLGVIQSLGIIQQADAQTQNQEDDRGGNNRSEQDKDETDDGQGKSSEDDAEEPSSSTAQSTTPELDLPLAPESERVDLATPSFSSSTNVTNPLFPISNLHAALLLGNVDGHLMRVETTLLPELRTIKWNGQDIETLVSQYVAYLDGRIEEVAIDWYAQADDGSVWYFGEDVFNYHDGVIADREGTWLAGKDGPAAMIMPANPQVGDVYRPENSRGIVFEEVTIKATDETVTGPSGPVKGAIIAEELHMDGSYEDKTFAPGYGEFSSGSAGNLEALALAIPTDALSKAMPAELETLFGDALAIFNAAETGDWDLATTKLEAVTEAWNTYQANSHVPELLAAQMTQALSVLAGNALAPAIHAQNTTGTRKAALDVAQASLDLQMQYRPLTEINLTRFDLWTLQILADVPGDEPSQIMGDVAVLEWVWERVRHTVDIDVAEQIVSHLDNLRRAANHEDLDAASVEATQLHDFLAGL
jgi:hypothetical protein